MDGLGKAYFIVLEDPNEIEWQLQGIWSAIWLILLFFVVLEWLTSNSLETARVE